MWLERALREVSKVGRVAFGAFRAEYKSPNEVEVHLRGCLFLKRSDFDLTCELKNLVVHRDENLGELSKPLIDKATRYCEVRSIPKLEIELPREDHSLITCFLDAGFKMAALRERYMPGRFVCLLERKVGRLYHADPFDELKVGRWLIQAILPSIVTRETTVSPVESEDPHGTTYISMEFEGAHQTYSSDEPELISETKRLRGQLLILERSDAEAADWNRLPDLFDPHRQLHYILAFSRISIERQSALTRRRVIPFDLNDLSLSDNSSQNSSLSIPMQKEEVLGVATTLEANLIDSYLSTKILKYYLLSGIGAALQVSEDSPPILAIYCPFWHNGKSGFVAIAEILEHSRIPFDKAFDQFPDTPCALSKEDLEYYRSEENERIGVVKCKILRAIKNPISLEDIGRISNIEISKYLECELNENFNSTAYLDASTCQAILNEFEKRPIYSPRLSDKEFKIGISYSKDERPFVEVVKNHLEAELGAGNVFFDLSLSSDLARPNLRQYLTTLFTSRVRLVVVFLCDSYPKREWCMEEWNAIQSLKLHKESDKIMYFHIGTPSLPDFSLQQDGSIDRANLTGGAQEAAKLILDRYQTLDK